MYLMAHNPYLCFCFHSLLDGNLFYDNFQEHCNKSGEYLKSFNVEFGQKDLISVTEFIMWNSLNNNSVSSECYFRAVGC